MFFLMCVDAYIKLLQLVYLEIDLTRLCEPSAHCDIVINVGLLSVAQLSELGPYGPRA